MSENEQVSIELTPGVISVNGNDIAPRTLTSVVYNEDGTPVGETIDDIYKIDRSCVVETRSVPVQIESDGQTIFDVPYPIDDFDLEKGTVMLLDSTNKLIPSSRYTYNGNQIVFDSSDFVKDDIITFVFHYADNVVLGGSNILSTLKRTVLINTSTTTVEIGISSFVRGKDTLLVYKNSVYIEESIDYNISFDNKNIEMINDNVLDINTTINFVVLKNTNSIACSLKNSVSVAHYTNKVAIGIPSYNMNTDTLIVYINGTYIESGVDYNVTSDSKYITSIDETFQYKVNSGSTFNFIVLKNIHDYEMIDGDDTVYANLLDNSSGLYGAWDDNTTVDTDGAHAYSNSLVITRADYEGDEYLISSNRVSSTLKKGDRLTLQAMVFVPEDVIFNNTDNGISIQLLPADGIITETATCTVNVTNTTTKNTWVPMYISTVLGYDIKSIVCNIFLAESGSFKVSEVKIANAGTKSDWEPSNIDKLTLYKKLSSLL